MNNLASKACYVLAAITLFCGATWAAEVAIDMEVVMAPGVPITAPQEWAERLGKLGLDRVQIRSARGEEKPSTKLNDTGTRVAVLAVLTKGNELVLPQRKFRVSQLSELKAYFANLPEQIVEAGIVRGPFRLTEQEFHAVMADLGKPLGTSTTGKTTRDLLAHCGTKFRMPIEQSPPADEILRTAQPLTVELEKFAAGTALAIALRREGLTLRPAHRPGGLKLVVEPYERGQEVWTVGWKAEETPRQLAPKLYEPLTIEIEGYTLATALTALAPRLTVPVVMDEWVLAELDIDPADIQVKLPAKKRFLKSAVDGMFSQARLACELRIDDGGMPFLWGTQYGPDSRPAQ
jgi:hypothetical protein